MVLGEAGRGAGPQQGVGFPHQLRRRRGHFGEQGQGRVFEGDGDVLKAHDVALVGLGLHIMEGHPGFGLAVDQDPVHRTAAPVAGQQAAVQVACRDQGPPAVQFEDGVGAGGAEQK